MTALPDHDAQAFLDQFDVFVEFTAEIKQPVIVFWS
jgi:hypothetical protein